MLLGCSWSCLPTGGWLSITCFRAWSTPPTFFPFSKRRTAGCMVAPSCLTTSSVSSQQLTATTRFSPLDRLTEFFGAYGLFAGFLLLLFLAARSSLLFLDRSLAGWTHGRIIFGSLLLGPVGFWFWDNPIYGFHLELLLLPLGIFYTLSMIGGSRWRWLWLALICLTREEGPLFAWSIHLLVLFVGQGEASYG